MYSTLKFPAPMPDAALKRQLLMPVPSLSNHLAAVALRAWWDSNTEDDLAHRGLRVWRAHIREQNSDPDADSIPLLLLEDKSPDGREIAVAIFSDASAVVLRSEKADSDRKDRCARFQVLPIVLSLSSSYRPTDGRPAFSLKVRRDRRSGAPPIITVGTGDQKDGWVNLEAGHFSSHGSATYEERVKIRSDILSCARAWADEIDNLPILHAPEQSHGYAAEAPLGEMLSKDLGFDPADNLPYACPAFLPFWAYANSDVAPYTQFCEDVATWMLMRLPEHIAAIHLVVLTARMSQTNKPSGPKFTVKVTDVHQNPDPQLSARASSLLGEILAQADAPIPLEKVVGQRLTRTPARMVSSFLSEQTLAFSHVTREGKKISSHDRMALEKRFSAFSNKL